MQLFHRNESPKNGIILPRGHLCLKSPGTQHGQHTKKQPVFPRSSLEQSPVSSPVPFCPRDEKSSVPSASFPQWHSNKSCALCQHLCLLLSSKMLRKINDGGEVPAPTGLRARPFCSCRSRDLASPSPWNFQQHSYTVLGFCYLK